MCKCIQWIGKMIGLAFLGLVLLFVVYFFNLDMKLTAQLQPLFDLIYDRVDRNRRL